MIAPERITLYCRKKDEDGVYHAFPVDSSNPNHDTAKSWSSESHGFWKDGQYVRVPPTPGTVFEFLNTDFDDVTIESLDIRGQGGRAYQVILRIDEDKFRVDLREDTLMDVIKNTGIRAGGGLNGTFCFLKDGSQTKLIREGTELHKLAIAEREKRETFTQTIKRSDLKPGYKYTTISGSSAIFLGFVYACDVDKDTCEVSKPKKMMLFVKDTDKVIKFLKNGEIVYREDTSRPCREVTSFSFTVSKAHNFKIEEGQVITEDRLSDYVSYINKLCKLEYDEDMAKQTFTRYVETYSKPLILSTMAVDKKDVHIPEDEGKKILYRVNAYYNNRSFRW